MNIRQAIQQHLLGTSALTALVGQRIYHQLMPQDEPMPAITWHIIDTLPTHTMGSDSGPYAVVVQVDCWGDGDDPTDVAVQVKAALMDFIGTMGGDGGVTVQRVLFEGERDAYDEADEVAGVMQEYTIWHE